MDLQFLIKDSGIEHPISDLNSIALEQFISELVAKELQIRNEDPKTLYENKEFLFQRIIPVDPLKKPIKKCSFYFYQNIRTSEIHKVPAGIWYNSIVEDRLSYFEFCLNHCQESLTSLVDRRDRAYKEVKKYGNENIEDLAYNIVFNRIWPSDKTFFYHQAPAGLKELIRQLDSLSFLIDSHTQQVENVQVCINNLKSGHKFS